MVHNSGRQGWGVAGLEALLRRQRAVVALVLAIVVVVLAFGLPSASSEEGGTQSSAETASGQRAADGAQLGRTTGVVSPPEPQPRLEPVRLQPGEQPPQFVVLSMDGGCETRSGVMRDLLDTADRIQAHFTFFLSGLCLVPHDRSTDYHAPGHEPGESDLPFADPDMVATRIDTLSRAYRSGHEIGTHFLGHFCGDLSQGQHTGVGLWNAEDWRSEIAQARNFLDTWPVRNPTAQAADLPFDASVMKGSRTPCLLGDRPELHAALEAEGFRYDASDPGGLSWPKRFENSPLWNFPLPALRLDQTNLWVLSMDYNFLANQNNARTDGDQATCDRVEQQTYQTYVNSLDAVLAGNRAPLILGSHLNSWLCGAYVKSIHRFLDDTAVNHPDVQFISFQELADWLEAQDPAVLTELQQRPGERSY